MFTYVAAGLDIAAMVFFAVSIVIIVITASAVAGQQTRNAIYYFG